MAHVLRPFRHESTHSVSAGIVSRVGASTQFALGYALEHLGMRGEARQAFHAALLLNSQHAAAWRHMSGQEAATPVSQTDRPGVASPLARVSSPQFSQRVRK